MNNIKNDLFEFTVGDDGIGILVINQVNNPAMKALEIPC